METKKQIEKIRSQYDEHTETDFDKLQKLDKEVKRPASIFAYVFGIIGALILGTGMSIVMGTNATEFLFIVGIAVGIIGIAMVSFNYMIYRAMLKSRRKKYASAIIELSDKILNN